MKKVYLICAESNNNSLYKIGFTKRNIEDRIKELKTGNSSNFYVVDYFESKHASKVESQIHRFFSNKSINGEWFLLDESDINIFKEKCNLYHNNIEFILNNNTYYIDKNEQKY